MTLDEAIKHAEEKAEELRNEAEHYEIAGVNVYGCEECAKEHDQLAEWLKDYKRLLEQDPCEDAISREDALMCLTGEIKETDTIETIIARFVRRIRKLPPVNPTKTGHWIPVSERLPEDTDPVNITWVNHDPESYYADIKDKPFTATGHYCNGRWWWYSVTCQDYLDEYGHWDIDAMDDAIEVIAWMPLPKPYEPQEI